MASRVYPIFRYEYGVMRVRFWNNCGFPEAKATLGERGVSRPPRLVDRGVRGFAASPSGGLSTGSLSGDVASRPCTSESVIDIAPLFSFLSAWFGSLFSALSSPIQFLNNLKLTLLNSLLLYLLTQSLVCSAHGYYILVCLLLL